MLNAISGVLQEGEGVLVDHEDLADLYRCFVGVGCRRDPDTSTLCRHVDAVGTAALHLAGRDEVSAVTLAADVELDVRVTAALGNLPTTRPMDRRHELPDSQDRSIDSFHELLLGG